MYQNTEINTKIVNSSGRDAVGVVPYKAKCIVKFYSNAESNITEVITLQGTYLSNTEINTKIAISSGRDARVVVPYKAKCIVKFYRNSVQTIRSPTNITFYL